MPTAHVTSPSKKPPLRPSAPPKLEKKDKEIGDNRLENKSKVLDSGRTDSRSTDHIPTRPFGPPVKKFHRSSDDLPMRPYSPLMAEHKHPPELKEWPTEEQGGKGPPRPSHLPQQQQLDHTGMKTVASTESGKSDIINARGFLSHVLPGIKDEEHRSTQSIEDQGGVHIYEKPFLGDSHKQDQHRVTGEFENPRYGEKITMSPAVIYANEGSSLLSLETSKEESKESGVTKGIEVGHDNLEIFKEQDRPRSDSAVSSCSEGGKKKKLILKVKKKKKKDEEGRERDSKNLEEDGDDHAAVIKATEDATEEEEDKDITATSTEVKDDASGLANLEEDGDDHTSVMNTAEDAEEEDKDITATSIEVKDDASSLANLEEDGDDHTSVMDTAEDAEEEEEEDKDITATATEVKDDASGLANEEIVDVHQKEHIDTHHQEEGMEEDEDIDTNRLENIKEDTEADLKADLEADEKLGQQILEDTMAKESEKATDEIKNGESAEERVDSTVSESEREAENIASDEQGDQDVVQVVQHPQIDISPETREPVEEKDEEIVSDPDQQPQTVSNSEQEHVEEAETVGKTTRPKVLKYVNPFEDSDDDILDTPEQEEPKIYVNPFEATSDEDELIDARRVGGVKIAPGDGPRVQVSPTEIAEHQKKIWTLKMAREQGKQTEYRNPFEDSDDDLLNEGAAEQTRTGENYKSREHAPGGQKDHHKKLVLKKKKKRPAPPKPIHLIDTISAGTKQLEKEDDKKLTNPFDTSTGDILDEDTVKTFQTYVDNSTIELDKDKRLDNRPLERRQGSVRRNDKAGFDGGMTSPVSASCPSLMDDHSQEQSFEDEQNRPVSAEDIARQGLNSSGRLYSADVGYAAKRSGEHEVPENETDEKKVDTKESPMAKKERPPKRPAPPVPKGVKPFHEKPEIIAPLIIATKAAGKRTDVRKDVEEQEEGKTRMLVH